MRTPLGNLLNGKMGEHVLLSRTFYLCFLLLTGKNFFFRIRASKNSVQACQNFLLVRIHFFKSFGTPPSDLETKEKVFCV